MLVLGYVRDVAHKDRVSDTGVTFYIFFSTCFWRWGIIKMAHYRHLLVRSVGRDS